MGTELMSRSRGVRSMLFSPTPKENWFLFRVSTLGTTNPPRSPKMVPLCLEIRMMRAVRSSS